MIALAIIKRYAAPLAILLLLAGAWLWHGRAVRAADAAGYRRATAEMQARILQANAATAVLEEQQRAKTNAAAAAWESTRNDLQSQVDSLLARKPVVRLCKSASSAVPVPSATTSASQPDVAPFGSEPAVSVGPDIGAAAVVLAGECERYRNQLNALQVWVRETR